jgi:hypothetical protein
MQELEILTLEELFRKVLQKDLVEVLTDTMPAENLCSYLFYSLFRKYGKGEIEGLGIYSTGGNRCLMFELDEEKTDNIEGWFYVSNYGFHLEFSTRKPNNREDSYIFPEMTVGVSGKIDRGVVIEEPGVYISGPKFEKYSLNYKEKGDIFDVNLFLLKVIQEDIFPLENWLKKQAEILRNAAILKFRDS